MELLLTSNYWALYYRIFELNTNIKTKLIELYTNKNLPRIYIKIDKIFTPKTKLTCKYLCESWQHLYKYFVYFLTKIFKLQTEESDNRRVYRTVQIFNICLGLSKVFYFFGGFYP